MSKKNEIICRSCEISKGIEHYYDAHNGNKQSRCIDCTLISAKKRYVINKKIKQPKYKTIDDFPGEIDEDIFEIVKWRKWQINKDGYFYIAKHNKCIKLFEIVMGLKTFHGEILETLEKGLCIEHIDGNRSNNKKDNLVISKIKVRNINKKKIIEKEEENLEIGITKIDKKYEARHEDEIKYFRKLENARKWKNAMIRKEEDKQNKKVTLKIGGPVTLEF